MRLCQRPCIEKQIHKALETLLAVPEEGSVQGVRMNSFVRQLRAKNVLVLLRFEMYGVNFRIMP